MKEKTDKEKKEASQIVVTRGRTFQGYVIKLFPKRAVVEFERTMYVKKYERFRVDTTRLHARVPEGVTLAVGDYVRVRECRPLSKIIHFVVTDVVRKVST